MELQGLGEIAMGERAERACQAAKGALYTERVTQETANRPFESEKAQAALVDLEEHGGSQDDYTEKKYYCMMHFYHPERAFGPVSLLKQSADKSDFAWSELGLAGAIFLSMFQQAQFLLNGPVTEGKHKGHNNIRYGHKH